MSRAVYPGSFDPITLGHLDIIRRSAAIFDEVIVAVSGQSRKKSFTFDEERRFRFISLCVEGLKNVRVEVFQGLVTSYARSVDAGVLVRGLRAVSDFEYELKMASMNRRLAEDIETMFMMTQTKYSFLSSSVVKEIAAYGGDISQIVPAEIHDEVVELLGEKA